MTPPLVLWQRERFPLRNGVFFTLFVVTGLMVARAATGADVALHWRDLAAVIAVWSYFLTVRVLDEHKDFVDDAVAHPDRVLQRGLVTLPQLARLCVIAAAVQIGVSLWLDRGLGPVTLAWLLVAAWTLLMAREFFVRRWLRARLLLYATSHMLVMPLVALWVATMGAPDAWRTPAAWMFAALAFFAGLSFEVARKLRAPEDEHPNADSYTQALGVRSAGVLLAGVAAGAVVAAIALTFAFSHSAAAAAAALLLVVSILPGRAIGRFTSHPTSQGAARSELTTAALVLATHVVPLIAILALRPLR